MKIEYKNQKGAKSMDDMDDYEYLSGDDYDDIDKGTWTFLTDKNRRIIGFIDLATNEIKYFNDKEETED